MAGDWKQCSKGKFGKARPTAACQNQMILCPYQFSRLMPQCHQRFPTSPPRPCLPNPKRSDYLASWIMPYVPDAPVSTRRRLDHHVAAQASPASGDDCDPAVLDHVEGGVLPAPRLEDDGPVAHRLPSCGWAGPLGGLASGSAIGLGCPGWMATSGATWGAGALVGSPVPSLTTTSPGFSSGASWR